MKKKRLIGTNGLFVTIFMLLIFGFTGELSAQLSFTFESLTRGKLWTTHENSLRYADNSLLETGAVFLLNYPGHTSGANPDELPNHINSGGYAIYGVLDGVAQGFTTTSVFYADELFINGENDMVKVQNFNIADAANPVEEYIEGSHIYTDLNLEINMKAMSWSFPKYDDFIMKEITITNRNASSTVSDIHFGIRVAPEVTVAGHQVGQGDPEDDRYGWHEDEEIFYFHDGWTLQPGTLAEVPFNHGPGPTHGDVGDAANLDPNVSKTELLSASYYSLVVIDSDGLEVFQNVTHYAHQGAGGVRPTEDDPIIFGTDPPAKFKTVMTTQQPRASWDELNAAGGVGGNEAELDMEFYLSVGPFDLAPGESRTVVYADVMGIMDRAKVVEGGTANIELMQSASLDSLIANVRAAKELYANNYRLADYPPPTPTNGEESLIIAPISAGNRVEWPPISESYEDPATGANDFAGYRVYRSTYFTIGPWELIAEIPSAQATIESGMVVYEDRGAGEAGLPLGVGNYYAVSSYDVNGNESGLVNASRFPSYPLRAVNEAFPKNVYVVPNPFRQNSGLLGSGEELRMEFIGLPATATIRIYTLAGELVRTIEHDDGSGAEAWGSILTLDYQTSAWSQYVAPGFYIYHVESKVEGQEGESFIGKFAIVR